jgi:Ca2+-binding RTX toxin-like protein
MRKALALTVGLAGTATALTAGGVATAPAALASNGVDFVIAESPWRFQLDLSVNSGGAFFGTSDLCSAGAGALDFRLDGTSMTDSPEFPLCTATVPTVEDGLETEITGRVTGRKIDSRGSSPVQCTFRIVNPEIGAMFVLKEQDCTLGGGVDVDLSGGLSFGLFNYTLTITPTGTPIYEARTMLDTAARVGAAARERDDCIMGTPGDDTIVGTPGDDCIIAGPGDDDIDGRGGNDTILAGPGDDTINGGQGDDTILAGSGDDTIDPGSGEDFINGATGTDTVIDDDDDSDTSIDSQFGGQ